MKSVLFLIVIITSFIIISCSSTKTLEKKEVTNYITTPSGLKYYDIKEGTGMTPRMGQKVYVHWIGTLENGTVFENSYEQKKPIEITLGETDLIKGMQEGLLTMKVGGKRKLIIPPDLAWGDRSFNKIPANATLIFEIELLKAE
jgi:FKBP-type peptidyl-prolyl cis-trans isomerase